jgi:hypothetical protein
MSETIRNGWLRRHRPAAPGPVALLVVSGALALYGGALDLKQALGDSGKNCGERCVEHNCRAAFTGHGNQRACFEYDRPTALVIQTPDGGGTLAPDIGQYRVRPVNSCVPRCKDQGGDDGDHGGGDDDGGGMAEARNCQKPIAPFGPPLQRNKCVTGSSS